MTATTQQTTACALQQSTRHPTDEKKLTSSSFVLTLEFTILNVPCVCSQNFRGIVCVWCETTVIWRGNGGSGGGDGGGVLIVFSYSMLPYNYNVISIHINLISFAQRVDDNIYMCVYFVIILINRFSLIVHTN